MNQYFECPYCGEAALVLNRITWEDGSYTLEGYCGECARCSVDFDADGKEMGVS